MWLIFNAVLMKEFDCVQNFEGYEESWIQVIKKTPFQVVKQLIIVINECSKFNHNKWEPLNIAIEAGDFELCKYIIGKAIF